MSQNKLALGTVQFGLPYGITNTTGQTTEDEVEKILKYAHAIGINTLDTAYGYGTAEEVLGRNHQNKFDIVTKFLPENANETIENQFQTSLERLQVDRVYGYLAHRPLDVIENPHLWKFINSLKETSQVQKIGFSFNTPEEYYLIKKAAYMPDLVQVPFNYFDTRFVNIMEELKSNGCEIHTRSTFLQGLFFSELKTLSQHFLSVRDILHDLQKDFSENLQGALLQYVMNYECIDKIVLGVQTYEQLKVNCNSLNNVAKLPRLTEHITDDILQPSKWIK